jgi:hypothetical protein
MIGVALGPWERGFDLYPVSNIPNEVGADIPPMNCDIQWAAVQNNSFHARMLLMPRDGAIIFACWRDIR